MFQNYTSGLRILSSCSDCFILQSPEGDLTNHSFRLCFCPFNFHLSGCSQLPCHMGFEVRNSRVRLPPNDRGGVSVLFVS